MSFVSPAMVPQALQTGYASRVRMDQTSLFVSTQAVARNNKRNPHFINYAEIEEDYEDDDEEDPSFGHDPATGLAKRGADRKTEIKKQAAPTRHADYTAEDLKSIADSEELLIPLRLNLDYENYKVTDFFMWNLREPNLTAEQFAIITCQDLDLPVGYTSTIANAIKAQVAEYTEISHVKLPESLGLQVIVHLSVNLDKHLYEDKFEWDLDTDLTPEAFARTVVADMGIAGEFYPAIAHALHEAVLRMKREVIEGHLPSDVENQAVLGGPAGLRADPEGVEDWTPTIEVLSQEEIERREMERERMIRRMKRESARMGSELDSRGFASRGKRQRRHESSLVGSPW